MTGRPWPSTMALGTGDGGDLVLLSQLTSLNMHVAVSLFRRAGRVQGAGHVVVSRL
jgi:hypothetical protein